MSALCHQWRSSQLTHLTLISRAQARELVPIDKSANAHVPNALGYKLSKRHSPTQRKMVFGSSERVGTFRVIASEFVVPTVLAVALTIFLSIGSVYLADEYLVSIDQAEPYHPVFGSQ
jgi:hypothetical protein